MVVIPQMFEQEITACRVTELGLGQHFLPDELSAQVLQKSVQQVSEDKQLKKRVYDRSDFEQELQINKTGTTKLYGSCCTNFLVQQLLFTITAICENGLVC